MIRHSLHRLAALSVVASVLISGPADAQPKDKATQLAETTIEQMGGLKAWNDRRYLVWDIYGESHYWDKWSGDFRWERDSLIVLMNIGSRKGRVWVEGTEVKDVEKKKTLVDRAYRRWVNNSYWLIMPYKLLDPGVIRRYVGVDTSEAGQISDVLELTFDNVGLTPNNRFQVFIDKQTGMVCQWAYFENAGDEEPGFVLPWNEWKEYDGMWMSTGRGEERRKVTNLSLPEDLPRSVFTDPKKVILHR